MITPIYAALIGLIFVALSVNVIRNRRSHAISLGDGGEASMVRSTRAQANCAEYAPIGLLLILMLEMQIEGTALVHLCGLALLLGRASHGYALTVPKSTVSIWRIVGMVLTFLSLIIASLGNLGAALF